MGNNIIETKEQLDQILLGLDELLEKGLVDEVYKKYTELIKKIERDKNETDNIQKAKIYASFAYFLFSVYEYEFCFNMLRKAQDYGYSRDEIENIILAAFIEPNLNEFKIIYEANIEFLVSNKYISIEKIVDFKELPYWLLPTGIKNEYYIYDKKEKLIQEKIILYKSQDLDIPTPTDEFSDYLIIDNYNLDNILSISTQIEKRNKKTYIILNDIAKFFSCLQGKLLENDTIPNILIFESFNRFENYFINTNLFLPRNIINLVEKSENAQNSISIVHNYRIRKEKRKRDNILLSICIPSFNRGKRAYDNIIHLLQSYYDEEIEIILSNNGTQNETKEYYEKIRDIEDARLKYFAFEENKGFAINCCKICELATGKFILLVSDEDLVNFDSLGKILNLLNQSKNKLSIMRTSTTTQSKPTVKLANEGKDALLTFMLTSNYMSGIIFNNNLLKQHKGIEYVKENLENSVCANYPHMFWELLLCQYGNVQGTEILLIHEGKAEKTEIGEMKNEGNKIKFPYYATIDGRLEQHEGFSNIFKVLEICQEDLDLYRELYIKLCLKTLFLVTLSINAYYKKTDINTLDLLDRAYSFCSRKEFFYSNRSIYRSDLKVIYKYYESFKKQI